MYFTDLDTSADFLTAPFVRAVGWLDATHPYAKGSVEQGRSNRIALLARTWSESTAALGWPVACGPHLCELCNVFRASGVFGVPHGDLLFVCPTMIGHYVQVHEYMPPEEFLAAVSSAPEPGTYEYAKATAPFVGHGFVMPGRDERLHQFFAGHFNQDWNLGGSSWSEVVTRYVESHPRPRVLTLLGDLRSWAEEAGTGGVESLPAAFGCDYDPRPDGHTERQWVETMAGVIERELTE